MIAESHARSVFHERALEYARNNIKVFPLYPQDKKPIYSGGFHTATTDCAQIDAWWAQHPDANIGAPTGELNGIVVVDPDGEIAVHQLQDFAKTHGFALDGPCSKTGSGGRHYFFKNDSRIKSVAPGMFKNVDTRGKGGYVVLPPSVHPNGTEYEWVVPLIGTTLPELPKLLLDAYQLLQRKEKVGAAANRGPKQTGTQETWMSQLAGAMLGIGADQRVIDAAMLVAAEVQCDPIMLEKDALRISNSIGSRDANDPLASLEYSERALSTRFAHVAGERVAYVKEMKSYAVFNSRQWEMDSDLETIPYYDEMLEAMEAIHAQMPSEADEDLVIKEAFGHYIESAKTFKKQDGAIKGARHLLTRRLDDFDAQQHLFNVENGTIDLRTSELLDHDPAHLITLKSPFNFTPGTQSEKWEAFITLITDGDAELASYLKRMAGYTLHGENSEQALHILYGDGATGKSTFVSIVRAVLGDYSAIADDGMFTSTKQSGAPNSALAQARGARLLSGVEVNATEALNEAFVKSITGNEEVTTRDLYKSAFKFKPQFVPWLILNDLPEVSGSSPVFRRIQTVPFNYVIPERQRDTDFARKIIESPKDMTGVLAWLVEGYQEWQDQGLNPPAAVRDLTQQYQEESNPVTEFVALFCDRAPDAFTPIANLWPLYVKWAEPRGIIAGKDSRKLTQGLHHMGIKTAKGTGADSQQRGYVGIRLKNNAEKILYKDTTTFEQMTKNRG